MTETTSATYIPYGDEWKKEVMKMTKDQIIEILLKPALIAKQEVPTEEEKQKYLCDMMPSDKERIDVAMLVSGTMHEETLINIVASVDMILDMMKRRAGMEVEGLDPLPSPPNHEQN